MYNFGRKEEKIKKDLMERVNEERGYLSFKNEIWFVLNEEREGIGFVLEKE